MISGKTRLAAVLGYPVEHSKSPLLHNAALAAVGIDAAYLALPVAPQDLPGVIASLVAIRALGASITVPHKGAVIDCCDRLAPSAEAVGAVNTLEFCDDGQVVGHNTDASGYANAFEEDSGQRIAGRDVVLLGAGGAARAVDVGVRQAGAASVRVVARSPAKVTWADAHPWVSRELEQLLDTCDLLIDCTSLGLSAESEAAIPAAIPLQRLPQTAVVSTLVYHRKTHLLKAAQTLGLQGVDGAGMLLHPGAIAFSIWTGQAAPLDVMRKALQGRDRTSSC